MDSKHKTELDVAKIRSINDIKLGSTIMIVTRKHPSKYDGHYKTMQLMRNINDAERQKCNYLKYHKLPKLTEIYPDQSTT